MGAKVVALEPSGGMIEILREKISAKGIAPDRIRIDQRAWQDVDVEEEGLAGQFDLVFVSMSPGVRDPETLEKVMQASINFCYLSTFVYSLGYRPRIDFTVWSHDRKETIDEAVENIIIFFQCTYPWIRPWKRCGFDFYRFEPGIGNRIPVQGQIAGRKPGRQPADDHIHRSCALVGTVTLSSN
jgi:hypothetical protein